MIIENKEKIIKIFQASFLFLFLIGGVYAFNPFSFLKYLVLIFSYTQVIFTPDVLGSFSDVWSNVKCEQIQSSVEPILISASALLFSTFLLTFLYMIATIINSETFKAHIKKEYGNLFVSLLIAISFSLIYSLSFDIIEQDLIIENGIFDISFEFARSTLNSLTMLFITVQIIIAYISVTSTSPIEFRPLGILGFSLKLTEALQPVISFLQNINKLVFVGIGVWAVVMFTLCFIRVGFLSLIFPMGIFFRCFTPTKGFGSILISISLGFYIFFPFFIFMNNVLFDMTFRKADISIDQAELTYEQIQNLTEQEKEQYDEEIMRGIKDLTGSPTGSFQRLTDFVPYMVLLFTQPKTLVMFLFNNFLIVLQRAIFEVLFLGFFMQILNIFLLFIVISNVAKVLDTRVDLSSIEKLL